MTSKLSDQDKQRLLSTLPGDTGKNVIMILETQIIPAEDTLKALGVKYKDFADIPAATAEKEKDKAAATPADTDGLEVVKALIPDLVESQGTVLDLMLKMAKKIDHLEASVKEARTALALTPTPASTSQQTIAPESKEKTDAESELEKKTGKDQGEVDPAFPGMGIKRGGV